SAPTLPPCPCPGAATPSHRRGDVMQFRFLAGLMLGGLCLAATALAQTAWKPSERINYIIGVAPGGTVGLYARAIKDSLERLKRPGGGPVIVESKVGAGGALAMSALRAGHGNAHYLGTFHTGAIAGAVTGLI